jgi:hypothetical protein
VSEAEQLELRYYNAVGCAFLEDATERDIAVCESLRGELRSHLAAATDPADWREIVAMIGEALGVSDATPPCNYDDVIRDLRTQGDRWRERAKALQHNEAVLIEVICDAVRGDSSITTLPVSGVLESKCERFLFSPDNQNADCTEGDLRTALVAAGVALHEVPDA